MISYNQAIERLQQRYTVDSRRTSNLVEHLFYQARLAALVKYIEQREPEIFCAEDGDKLPSWQKVCKTNILVRKSKRFWIDFWQIIANGTPEEGEISDFVEMNIDLQVEALSDSRKCVMTFLPANTQNKAFARIVEYAKEALGDSWIVLGISGDTTSNKEAELEAQKKIAQASCANKNVMILSKGMASRSFSIPEIDTIFLCYDNGSVDSFQQQMSRALTQNDGEKTARIISWSFDPERDDKFDDYILRTAASLVQRGEVADMSSAIARTINTIRIFRFAEAGVLAIDPDQYLEQLNQRSGFLESVVRGASLSALTGGSKDKGRVECPHESIKGEMPSGSKPERTGNGSSSKGEKDERKAQEEMRRKIRFIAKNCWQLLTVSEFWKERLGRELSLMELAEVCDAATELGALNEHADDYRDFILEAFELEPAELLTALRVNFASVFNQLDAFARNEYNKWKLSI
jgi:hypothetical protein